MSPAFEYTLNIRCVTLFNALFNIEQTVQVRDTTKTSKEPKAHNKNIYISQ
ncbi:hypothetical protein BH10BAC2_BH10BAC2_19830 [soil metagenome]